MKPQIKSWGKAVLLVSFLALAGRSRDVFSQDLSGNLTEKLAQTEKIIALTVYKNKALEAEIRALRLQLGIPGNEALASSTLWQKAEEISKILDQAMAELGSKAAAQEFATLRDQVGDLETYAEEVGTELYQKALLSDFNSDFASIQKDSDKLQSRIDGIERDLYRVYAKATEWLTSFSSEPDIEWD